MKLTPITEAAREAQVTEVFRLVESGEPVLDACREVGITPRQYYYWMARSSAAIEAIKSLIADQERRTILDIATARHEAIRKITDSVYEETNVIKLMQIESHLRVIQGDIEERHGISSMDRAPAEFMLTGPETEIQASRTSISVPHGSEVTLNISAPKIIDITSEEDNEN